MIDIHLPHFVSIIVNLLILYFLMKKFLFKPVTEFMENRTNSIQKELDDANNKKSEAENLKQQYNDALKAAHKEAAGIIEAAKRKAGTEAETILLQARKDTESMIARAQVSIENERQNVLKAARNQIASLAFAAATKIIQKNMDTESNKKVVENFLDEEGVA